MNALVDDPLLRLFLIGLASVLAAASLIVFVGIPALAGTRTTALQRELKARTLTWIVLVPAVVLPIMAGPRVTIMAFALLSVLCFGEFARATGLFRERLLSGLTIVAILALYFAVMDHWYGLFVALIVLSPVALTVASLPQDQPKGYIQRTALAVMGFLLFGATLAHLAYIANDPAYRPILLMLIFGVALTDVAAFVTGKLFGRTRLVPNTSPGKTRAGAVGGLVVAASFVFIISGPIFADTAFDQIGLRIGLGVLVGTVSQLGDMTLSAIKRDLGIKDTGAVLPGHGGILDRFNSLLLVAPAAFHYIGHFTGFGLGQPTRVLTGGL